MSLEEKIALLEETFETEEGTLSEATVLDELEEYSSLTKLSLIVMMEDEFGVKLTSEEVRNFKTIGDILEKMK